MRNSDAFSPCIFHPKRVAFGRAQTFPLRLGWLPKICAFLLAQSDKKFSDDDVITELGVGKNMITSIKHWARSADVLSESFTLTDFGRQIFSADGFDPYLEDEATLWLLHWKIASRPHCFTAGYFLFNHYFNPDDFIVKEATDEIVKQLQREEVHYVASTVKRDIGTALNMYARRGDDDESLESPFPALGLIRPATGAERYTCNLELRETLPAEVVGYAAAELLIATDSPSIPLNGNLWNEKCASLDAVFRLTEDALIQKVSDFCVRFPAFNLRDVAGSMHLFFTGDKPDMNKLLSAVYTPQKRKHVT